MPVNHHVALVHSPQGSPASGSIQAEYWDSMEGETATQTAERALRQTTVNVLAVIFDDRLLHRWGLEMKPLDKEATDVN